MQTAAADLLHLAVCVPVVAVLAPVCVSMFLITLVMVAMAAVRVSVLFFLMKRTM